MSRGFVGSRCGADEGGGESPGYADEEEAEDVVEDWGGWGGLVVGHCGVIGRAFMGKFVGVGQ